MDAPFWYVSLDEMGNFMYYKNRDPGRRETDHGSPGIKAMRSIKSMKEKGSIMRKVILDVDTGTDDAIAIMCAIQAEELDVLAVCTVNGNRGVSYTTENTLRLLEYLGREEIPVYRGCALPMVSTLPKWRRPEIPFGGYEFKAQEVHGDYLDLPHSQNKKAEEMDAVSYYIKTLTETKEKITLVPVGPLTNLAVALRAKPEIVENIEEIVIMGAAYAHGNITAAAEFNWWCDPEAAKIVMDCGAKITIVPLDATHKALVSGEEADRILAGGTKACLAAGDFIKRRIRGYAVFQPVGDDMTPVHDALAVLYLIDKSVCRDVKPMYVDVDFGMGASDGMSIVDVDHRYEKEPNCEFAFSANREKFVALLEKTLKAR